MSDRPRPTKAGVPSRVTTRWVFALLRWWSSGIPRIQSSDPARMQTAADWRHPSTELCAQPDPIPFPWSVTVGVSLHSSSCAGGGDRRCGSRTFSVGSRRAACSLLFSVVVGRVAVARPSYSWSCMHRWSWLCRGAQLALRTVIWCPDSRATILLDSCCPSEGYLHPSYAFCTLHYAIIFSLEQLQYILLITCVARDLLPSVIALLPFYVILNITVYG
jgi:hypothetical protein